MQGRDRDHDEGAPGEYPPPSHDPRGSSSNPDLPAAGYPETDDDGDATHGNDPSPFASGAPKGVPGSGTRGLFEPRQRHQGGSGDTGDPGSTESTGGGTEPPYAYGMTPHAQGSYPDPERGQQGQQGGGPPTGSGNAPGAPGQGPDPQARTEAFRPVAPGQEPPGQPPSHQGPPRHEPATEKFGPVGQAGQPEPAEPTSREPEPTAQTGPLPPTGEPPQAGQPGDAPQGPPGSFTERFSAVRPTPSQPYGQGPVDESAGEPAPPGPTVEPGHYGAYGSGGDPQDPYAAPADYGTYDQFGDAGPYQAPQQGVHQDPYGESYYGDPPPPHAPGYGDPQQGMYGAQAPYGDEFPQQPPYGQAYDQPYGQGPPGDPYGGAQPYDPGPYGTPYPEGPYQDDPYGGHQYGGQDPYGPYGQGSPYGQPAPYGGQPGQPGPQGPAGQSPYGPQPGMYGQGGPPAGGPPGSAQGGGQPPPPPPSYDIDSLYPTKGRGGKGLIVAGLALVVIVIGGGGAYLALNVFGGEDPQGKKSLADASSPVNSPSSSSPTESSTPSPPPSPTFDAAEVRNTKVDPKTMPLSEAFPENKVKIAGHKLELVAKDVSKKCKPAGQKGFGKELLKANCQRVLRATFVDTKKKYAVTMGIAVLKTRANAKSVEKAAKPGKNVWFKALPGKKKSGAGKIARSGGLSALDVEGHYVVFAFAAQADKIKLPKNTKDLSKLSSKSLKYAREPIIERGMVTPSPEAG